MAASLIPGVIGWAGYAPECDAAALYASAELGKEPLDGDATEEATPAICERAMANSEAFENRAAGLRDKHLIMTCSRPG